jgi:hypothetical protein
MSSLQGLAQAVDDRDLRNGFAFEKIAMAVGFQ